MKQIQLLLEDYIALLRVGVYDHERQAPQRVRVNISVKLRQIPLCDDLSQTYDYTLMIAAIQELSGTHFDLLESFASALADKILFSQHLAKIEIELMKLDILDNGRVGLRYCFRK